jgi:hypothetical protein
VRVIREVGVAGRWMALGTVWGMLNGQTTKGDFVALLEREFYSKQSKG